MMQMAWVDIAIVIFLAIKLLTGKITWNRDIRKRNTTFLKDLLRNYNTFFVTLCYSVYTVTLTEQSMYIDDS